MISFKDLLNEVIGYMDPAASRKYPISFKDKTAMMAISELLELTGGGKVNPWEFRGIYDVKKNIFYTFFANDGTHGHGEDFAKTIKTVDFMIDTKTKIVDVRDDEGFLTDLSFKGPKQDKWNAEIKKYFRGFKVND